MAAPNRIPLAGLILMAVIYAITMVNRLLDGAVPSGDLSTTEYAKSAALINQNGIDKEKKKTYRYPLKKSGDKLIFEGNAVIDLKAKTIKTEPYEGNKNERNQSK